MALLVLAIVSRAMFTAQWVKSLQGVLTTLTVDKIETKKIIVLNFLVLVPQLLLQFCLTDTLKVTLN